MNEYPDLNLCCVGTCHTWTPVRCDCCSDPYCPDHLRTVIPQDTGLVERWCADCVDHADIVLDAPVGA